MADKSPKDPAASGRTPTSDVSLARITVGARQPHNAPVVLVPYSAGWPADFKLIDARIRDALGDRAQQVEHVGSTSVPGLCAKPVIDVLLVVADAAAEADYVTPLERDGFSLRIREPDWYQHRLLRADWIDTHVHVFSNGCPEIVRMLGFRDRLRTSAEDRALYADTKQSLAKRTWEHVQHYADAKSEVVEAILSRAETRVGTGAENRSV